MNNKTLAFLGLATLFSCSIGNSFGGIEKVVQFLKEEEQRHARSTPDLNKIRQAMGNELKKKRKTFDHEEGIKNALKFLKDKEMSIAKKVLTSYGPYVLIAAIIYYIIANNI